MRQFTKPEYLEQVCLRYSLYLLCGYCGPLLPKATEAPTLALTPTPTPTPTLTLALALTLTLTLSLSLALTLAPPTSPSPVRLARRIATAAKSAGSSCVRASN